MPASLLTTGAERLPGVRFDRPVGDPVLGPPPLELLGHLVERPGQRQRDVQRVGRVDAEGGRHLAGQALGVVGDHDEADQGVELELVEAVARRLLHPGDLGAGALGCRIGSRLDPARPLAQVHVDADDVGVPRREGQHAPAPASDDERGPRVLHGPRREGVPEHLVVLAVEVERAVGAQQSLDHLHRLLEARHPDGRVVVGEPGLVVVAAHPARAQAQLEAALAQQVEGGRLLGQHERVAVVVAEDEGPHPERARGGRHRGQGGHGGQLVAEVVGHEQGAVAEVLCLAGLLGPGAGRAVRRLAQLRGEAEPAVVCHGDIVPQIGPGMRRRVGGGQDQGRRDRDRLLGAGPATKTARLLLKRPTPSSGTSA